MPECLEAHLEYLRLRGLSQDTMYQRARALIRFREHLGVNLFTATPDDLAAWRASLAPGEDWIHSQVSHVRQFYAWGVRVGRCSINPAEDLPLPKLPRRLPRPISEEKLLLALDCAPPRIRPWLVLAGWCGLRAKEIALLRRQSVLEQHRPPVIVIARDATKGRRERIMPMSDFVVAELLPVLPPSGWVFRRLDGRPGPNTPGVVSRLCNLHLHECGIPDTLHQLRHRFLTEAYQATRDIRLVQELAGHASPTTTAGYAAYAQADAVAAVQAIPAPRRLRAVSQGGGELQ